MSLFFPLCAATVPLCFSKTCHNIRAGCTRTVTVTCLPVIGPPKVLLMPSVGAGWRGGRLTPTHMSRVSISIRDFKRGVVRWRDVAFTCMWTNAWGGKKKSTAQRDSPPNNRWHICPPPFLPSCRESLTLCQLQPLLLDKWTRPVPHCLLRSAHVAVFDSFFCTSRRKTN